MEEIFSVLASRTSVNLLSSWPGLSGCHCRQVTMVKADDVASPPGAVVLDDALGAAGLR